MAIINKTITENDSYIVEPAIISTKTIEIDGHLSLDSSNPVQNKVLTQRINDISTIVKKSIVDTELNTTSENPVQNKVITSKIDELNTKIDNIEVGSVVIDTELNTTSENPVQNKVITSKIDELNTKIDGIECDILIDTELDETSENPVQNKVITQEIDELNDKIDNISLSSYLTGKEGFEAQELNNIKDIKEAFIKMAAAFGWNELS